jgi:NADP-dependent 3-hydroxy acid dehydrogenase YdfG
MPKTALITGATSGFGAACARRFAKEGWRLILSGRRTERLEELRRDLGEAVTAVITLDVRDREAVFSALQGLSDVDLLLNNAGLALGIHIKGKFFFIMRVHESFNAFNDL